MIFIRRALLFPGAKLDSEDSSAPSASSINSAACSKQRRIAVPPPEVVVSFLSVYLHF